MIKKTASHLLDLRAVFLMMPFFIQPTLLFVGKCYKALCWKIFLRAGHRAILQRKPLVKLLSE